MKLPEPKTYYDAMLPTLLGKWIFGLGIIQYPSGHFRQKISMFWSMTHVIFILVILYLQFNYLEKSESPTAASFRLMTHVAGVLTVAVSIYDRLTSKSETYWVGEIIAVNENFVRLGIPEDYGPAFKLHLFSSIGSVLSLSLLMIYDSMFALYVRRFEFVPMLGVILMYYQTYTGIMIDCNICCNLRYILNRFKHLNTYLVQFVSNKNKAKIIVQDFDKPVSLSRVITRNIKLVEVGNEQCEVHVLQETRNLHRSLCEIANKINNESDIFIFLSIVISFCRLTTGLYSLYAYISARAVDKSIRMMPWIVVYILKIVMLVLTCSTTTSEARRTGQLIYRLLNPTSSPAIRDEIHTFALQLLQNPLELTAGQLFTLDKRLLCTMVGSVATYLIIIVQLQGGSAHNRPCTNITSVTHGTC